MSNEAYNTKRIRGHVVSGLRSFYPNGISGRLIHRDILGTPFPHLEWIEALRQLDYLVERGFVEVVDNGRLHKSTSARTRMFRLTAQGLDVATGIVEDAAIESEV